MIAHVTEADRAYARELGLSSAQFDGSDDAVEAMRTAMLAAIRAARAGDPLAGRRWPARYAAHRLAWHALDHAWEIEDRTETA